VVALEKRKSERVYGETPAAGPESIKSGSSDSDSDSDSDSEALSRVLGVVLGGALAAVEVTAVQWQQWKTRRHRTVKWYVTTPHSH
jgi:hypothetical protein